MSKLYETVEKIIHADSVEEAKDILYGRDGIPINTKEHYQRIISMFIKKKELMLTKNGNAVHFDLDNNIEDIWDIVFISEFVQKQLNDLSKEIDKKLSQSKKGSDERKSLNEQKRKIKEYQDSLNKLNDIYVDSFKSLDNIKDQIEELKRSIKIINDIRNSFSHEGELAKDDGSIDFKGDNVYINNPQGKIEIDIPIDYLDGFVKGRIIAQEQDKVIIEKTNNIVSPILKELGYDISKIESFFYNIDPNIINGLLEYFDNDITKVYQMPEISQNTIDILDFFKKNNLSIDISNFHYTAFRWPEKTILLLSFLLKNGIDIENTEWGNFFGKCRFDRANDYIYVMSFIIKNKLKINMANFPNEAYLKPHNCEEILYEIIKGNYSFDINKLPFMFYLDVELAKRILDDYRKNDFDFDIDEVLYHILYRFTSPISQYEQLSELHKQVLEEEGSPLEKWRKVAKLTIKALRLRKQLQEEYHQVHFNESKDKDLEIFENYILSNNKIDELESFFYKNEKSQHLNRLYDFLIRYPEKTLELFKYIEENGLSMDISEFNYYAWKDIGTTKRLLSINIPDEYKQNILNKIWPYLNTEKAIFILEKYHKLITFENLNKLLFNTATMFYYLFDKNKEIKKTCLQAERIFKSNFASSLVFSDIIKQHALLVPIKDSILSSNIYRDEYENGLVPFYEKAIENFILFMETINLNKLSVDLNKISCYHLLDNDKLNALFSVIDENSLPEDIVYDEYGVVNSSYLFLNINRIKTYNESSQNKRIDIGRIPSKCLNVNFGGLSIKNLLFILEYYHWNYEKLEELPQEFFTCDINILEELLQRYNSNIARSIFGVNNPKIISLMIYMNSVFRRYDVNSDDSKIENDKLDTMKICHDGFVNTMMHEDGIKTYEVNMTNYMQQLMGHETMNDLKKTLLENIRNASIHYRIKPVRDKEGNLVEDMVYLYDEDNYGNNNFNIVLSIEEAYRITREVEIALGLDLDKDAELDEIKEKEPVKNT